MRTTLRAPMCALALLLGATALQAGFVDEADARGVSSSPDMLGVAWSDVNGDTLPDFYVSVLLPPVGGFGDNRLYVQQADGTFLDQASDALRNGGNGYGISIVDFNEDGAPDIYLSNGLLADPLGLLPKDNKLFWNEGAGTFVRAGASSGVEDVPSGRSAVAADYDKDGDLDLFVAEPFGERDQLYRNNGDGTFSDVSSLAGLINDDFNGNGATWGDFNNDGWPDIYVANHGEPNLCSAFGVACERDYLYENQGPDGNGNVTFAEVGTQRGLTLEEPSFGGAWGDYDNDGDLDLYITNGFDLSIGGSSAPNMLYHNNLMETGSADFIERAADAGVGDNATSFSANWADYDNDGRLDLFWTNAFSSGSNPQNRLFWNAGPGPGGMPLFVDQTDVEIGDTARGQGAAWADFNGDGFLDIVVLNIVDAPLRLYRNEGNANHWLHVDTIGTDSNMDGVGARLSLYTPTKVLHREVYAGGGYLSQDSLEVEFGLGQETTIDSLVIQWPSGCVQTLEPDDFGGTFPIDQRISIVEDCSIEPEFFVFRGFWDDLLALAGPPPEERLPVYDVRPDTAPWTDSEPVLDDPRLFFYLADTEGGTLTVAKDRPNRSVQLNW